MIDRFFFLSSRFLWPLHSLIFLAAVGIAYGASGVADYTYALAICGPLYFLVSYSFPMFLLVSSTDGQQSVSLAWLRVASVLGTIPLMFGIAMLVPSTQANVVIALWLVKLGEMVFDPVPAVIASRAINSRRGSQLFLLDLARVALAQGVMWFAILGAGWGIVRTLAAVGVCNLALGIALFFTVPAWTKPSSSFKEDGMLALKSLISRATPMTLSGALLALLVNLPRLIAEPWLTEIERAVFGVAQILGTGLAVLFNSVWLYEFHRIRADVAAQRKWSAVRTNGFLSAIFCAALLIGAALLVYAQLPLLRSLNIITHSTTALPLLFAALGIQHCISSHRDVLKLAGKQWREVQIIVQALAAATASFYVAIYGFEANWLAAVTAMCLGSAALQVTLSIVLFMRPEPKAATSLQQSI